MKRKRRAISAIGLSAIDELFHPQAVKAQEVRRIDARKRIEVDVEGKPFKIIISGPK